MTLQVDFVEWDPGEPNDWPPEGEDCAKVFQETGGWNDIPCYWPTGYVCKRALAGEFLHGFYIISYNLHAIGPQDKFAREHLPVSFYNSTACIILAVTDRLLVQ